MPSSVPKIHIRDVQDFRAMMNSEHDNSKPTHEQKIKLIGCVQKHQCLYDKKAPQYTNREYKDTLWTAIAGHCKISSGPIARIQWTRLRSGYITALDTKKKKWPYYKLLRFMKSYINIRRKPVEVFIEDDDDNNIPPQQLTEPSTSAVNPHQNAMTHIHDESPSSVNHDLLEVSLGRSLQLETTEVPEEKLKKFFEYAYLRAKDLPPNLQRRLEKEISDLLYNMQESCM